MPTVNLAMKLCLDDMPVPFVPRSMALYDPREIVGGDTDEDDYTMLPLKISGNQAFCYVVRDHQKLFGRQPEFCDLRPAVATLQRPVAM